MPVEFLGIAGVNPASEVTPRRGGILDLEYTRRLARAHEDNGWDRILFAYHSGSPDPAQVAAYVAGHTERINLVIAHRPNVSAPTFFAKTIATLDHLSGGRAEVHFITGGSTADQAAEGDHLDKDTRYERTREYIRIVKQAWTSPHAFDYDGAHYDIRGYRPDIRPVQQPRPRISFGGSSDAAYRVGAAEADVYALWGEPLTGTRQQIASIGRRGRPAAPPAAGRVPADHRADAGAGLGQGRDHPGPDLVHRGRRPGTPSPPWIARERRCTKAAGRFGRPGPARPGALDRTHPPHRRAGQLDGARRHPGDGGGRPAGLLRPGHRPAVCARLRHLRRRDRFRPVRDPAGPSGGGRAGCGDRPRAGRSGPPPGRRRRPTPGRAGRRHPLTAADHSHH